MTIFKFLEYADVTNTWFEVYNPKAERNYKFFIGADNKIYKLGNYRTLTNDFTDEELVTLNHINITDPDDLSISYYERQVCFQKLDSMRSLRYVVGKLCGVGANF